MIDEERIHWIFEQVHGPMDTNSACYTEIAYDSEENPIGMHLMKHGNVCWTATIPELLLEYVTKNIFPI